LALLIRLGQPGLLLLRRPLQDRPQVAFVQQQRAVDGRVGGQIGHDPHPGHALDLLDRHLVPRIPHRHVQLPLAAVEGNQPVQTGVLLRHGQEHVPVHIGRPQVRELDAPGLGQLFQQEPERNPAPLDDRLLEGDLETRRQQAHLLELVVVHDFQFVDEERPQLLVADAHAARHRALVPYKLLHARAS
jgi:hypothetical protein